MRNYCEHCFKVIDACYCQKIIKYNTSTKIIILQHPSETKHAINTARIAHLSFNNSLLYIGEDFSQHEELNQHIQNETCYLLFPSETSTAIEEFDAKTNITLIIIDGQWKKAKKILYLSKNLQKLPTLQFNLKHTSRYQIRKTPKPGYISTLEATTYALEQIEHKDFSKVFEAFDYMINYQIEKMGLEVFQKNYKEKK